MKIALLSLFFFIGSFIDNIKFNVDFEYYSGSGTTWLALIDYNGDQFPEIIAANKNESTLSVFLVDSSGKLSLNGKIYLPAMPKFLIAENLDDDSYKELIVGCTNHKIFLFKCTGNDTILEFGNFTSYNLLDMKAVDIDSNGYKDIITANGSNFQIHQNFGEGAFLSTSFYNILPYTSENINYSDIDKDGDIDLIFAASGTNKLYIVRNNGQLNFSFNRHYTVAQRPTGLMIEDLNSDNWPDIVNVNKFSDSFSVSLNNGNGTFATHTQFGQEMLDRPLQACIEDVNLDNKIDIIVMTWSGISVFYNDGSGNFNYSFDHDMGYGLNHFIKADLNCDQKVDVVTANSSNTVRVNLNFTGNSSALKLTMDVYSAPRDIKFADVDQDSNLDAYVLNNKTDAMYIFKNAGNRNLSFEAKFLVGDSPDQIQIADLNNDDVEEVIINAWLSKLINILFYNGSLISWTKNYYYTGLEGPSSIKVTDVNNDNKLDLIYSTRYWENYNLYILYGFDGFTADSIFSGLVLSQPQFLESGNMDADSQIEIFVIYNSSNILSKLEVENNSLVRTDYVFGEELEFIKICDLNNDNFDDLIVVNSGGSHNLFILPNDGYGNLGPELQLQISGTPLKLDLLDVDSDGDLDIFTTNSYSYINILENKGNFIFDEKNFFIGTSLWPNPICFEDIDKDGNKDLSFASSRNSFSNSLSTLEIYFNLNAASGINDSTGNNKPSPVPGSFTILQNYPNPFNSGTTIKYFSDNRKFVELQIFNITGQLIKKINAISNSENYSYFSWDGTNFQNQQVASGIYFYKLKHSTITKKMLLIR